VNSKSVNSRYSRQIAIAVYGAFLLTGAWGCGGGEEGPERYEAWGAVTFDGQPVPSGVVTFQHADSQLIAVCPIEDGSYQSPSGEGPLAGNNIVRIAGYDAPDGNLLWGSEWTTKVEVPKEGLEKDFAIKKGEVRPPGKRVVSNDPGDQ
jgi:hypothetical protein